jgi:hypothetical protein
VNNYDNSSSGYLGNVGLQKAGNYLCAAYPEWDEGGVGDTLRVKAFDGVRWRRAGLSGLPAQRAGFNQAAFCARNGKMYLAYCNQADRRITVLQLK